MSNFGDCEHNYIGFDLSTQQLKATVVNELLEIVFEAFVTFDKDLPEFRTSGGVHKHPDGKRVTAPSIMWIKSIDILLEKLKVSGLDFSTVAGVSGAGQQHGSVFWKYGTKTKLQNLSPDKFLHEELQGCFSISDSPVWMDSSTTEQCQILETFMGGAETVAQITGSRAMERFTGNQIAKLFLTRPESYKSTERISLVSSFVASILLGDYAPIDYSDGSGMNLLDISTKKWCTDCLHACAPDLDEKLGLPVPSDSVLGPISNYFVERYNFSPTCKVIAFMGDNPASLVGLRLRECDMAVSLGTSDTVFIWLTNPKPNLIGNIFINPIDPQTYMGLLCFKNGSLTRQRICDSAAEGDWDLFTELLNSTPRGNFGNIGLYYDNVEIIPPIEGDYRFNKNNDKVARFSKEVEVRAVVEGQCIAKRAHAEDLGFALGSRILATGGATRNQSLLQVVSDVFNSPVYIQTSANSASLGAAYMAKFALSGNTVQFEKMFLTTEDFKLAAEPARDAEEIYKPMVTRYRKLEASLLKKT